MGRCISCRMRKPTKDVSHNSPAACPDPHQKEHRCWKELRCFALRHYTCVLFSGDLSTAILSKTRWSLKLSLMLPSAWSICHHLSFHQIYWPLLPWHWVSAAFYLCIAAYLFGGRKKILMVCRLLKSGIWAPVSNEVYLVRTCSVCVSWS